MLPGIPRTPRRALANKDTNTPLDSPNLQPSKRAQPSARPSQDAVDRKPLYHTLCGAADEESEQPSSAVFGSSCAPTHPTPAHGLGVTPSVESGSATLALDVRKDHDAPLSVSSLPSLPLPGSFGHSPELSLGTGDDLTTSGLDEGSSAPSIPSPNAPSSRPHSPSSREVPVTQAPAPSNTSPADWPLTAFACPTPVRVYTPSRRPLSGTPSSSILRSAAEHSDLIDQAAVDALAMMEPDDVTALIKSNAVAQGKWLDTALYRARLDLTAAPIKLPKASRAYEYMIPGSTQALWIVTLRSPDPQHVLASDAIARPTPPRKATSASHRQTLTSSTPFGRALAELKILPQREQEEINATPGHRSKWLAAAEQPCRTPTRRATSTSPLTSLEEIAAVRLARLPSNASNPIEAVIKANGGLSPTEHAVVHASSSANEAWRPEVVRLWKVKRRWPTASNSPPASQDNLSHESAVEPLRFPSDRGHSTQCSSSVAPSVSPTENPFTSQSYPCQPSNPFAARLRSEALTRSREAGASPLPQRPEYESRLGSSDAVGETITKALASRPALSPLKPPLIRPQPSAHGAHGPLGLARVANLRRPQLEEPSYPKPPVRAFSHSHSARKHATYLAVEAKRVPRRYDQPTTPHAWSEYVRKVETDSKQDEVCDEAEIQRRLAAGRHRHQQRYTKHTAVRGAHQWAHVAPLADVTSGCAKYVRLMEAYPKWVAGAGAGGLDLNKDAVPPCHDCAGIAKDKEMLAWLKLEAKVGRLKPDLAATTELDIAKLEEYLEERGAEQHECSELLLDRLPEDAVTLLELRIFYGLGNTPTIPCLFWSCPAAYEAAGAKLVRLRTRVDLVNGPVDATLLKTVKSHTRTLRKELYTLGAFIGWLPLDHGCEPSRPPVLGYSLAKQYMSGEPLRERKLSGPNWITYQQTYKRLGPDATFWYDRLERGIVIFDTCFDPTNATLDPTPRKLTPAQKRKQHLVEGVEHLGAVYNLVSLPGPAWRPFPEEGRAVRRWPLEFAGSTLPVIAVLKRNPNLAQNLSNTLFELAVRAQAW